MNRDLKQRAHPPNTNLCQYASKLFALTPTNIHLTLKLSAKIAPKVLPEVAVEPKLISWFLDSSEMDRWAASFSINLCRRIRCHESVGRVGELKEWLRSVWITEITNVRMNATKAEERGREERSCLKKGCGWTSWDPNNCPSVASYISMLVLDVDIYLSDFGATHH